MLGLPVVALTYHFYWDLSMLDPLAMNVILSHKRATPTCCTADADQELDQ